MKRFLQIYAVVLIFSFVFLFFGGSALFDFQRHFFAAGAACAFIAALVFSAFLSLTEKIEALEERVRALEAGTEPEE